MFLQPPQQRAEQATGHPRITGLSENLFNLAADVSESNDLKEKEPEIFKKLKAEFEALDREMLAPYIFKKSK